MISICYNVEAFLTWAFQGTDSSQVGRYTTESYHANASAADSVREFVVCIASSFVVITESSDRTDLGGLCVIDLAGDGCPSYIA
jgi:hypothetical protein